MQRNNLSAVSLKTIIELPVTRFVIALALVLIALVLLSAEDAEGTHYRYATLSWEGTDTPNEAEFSGNFAVRHSFPDFNDPDVGDVIDLESDLVTGGNFYPVHLRVDSINEVHDWLFGSIVNASGDPIRHTYNAPNNNGDPHPVSWMDCCRLLEDDGLDLNHHVNNHYDGTGRIRLEAEVDLAPDEARNAKTSHVPITPCPREGLCTFQIPSDPHFDSVDFRLATSTEAGGPSGFVQPGPPHSDFASEIDPDTGVVTWNTTGAIFDENFANNLYSMQVVIEFNGHRTPLDFLIRLTHDDENPPFWVEPPTPCDETLTATANTPFSFAIEGQSPHEDRTVTLDHLGLPPGATLTIDPPIPDNPATGTFDWTPTGDDLGTHIVVFRIEDNTGLNGPGCNVSIDVVDGDPELAVNKTAAQPSISAGEQASFSISVDNIGNATALDVQLTDSLPAGLTWEITEETGGAACDITAGELECTLDELDPGQGFSVSVEATTTSAQCPGPLENTAFADASNQEPTSQDSATITVECPDLEVVKVAVDDPVSAGEDAEFTITVTNVGAGTAFDVEITDELPTGLDWSEDHPDCSIADGILICTVGELAPGQDFAVTIRATTSASDCAEGPISNTASADASNQDASSQDSATITVECPELVVEKTPHNDPVNAGEEAGFTITLTNIGEGTAFNVDLTDELPSGLSWNPDNAACAIIGDTLECEVGTLLPEEDFVVNISAITTASECGAESLWNNAVANASNQDGSSEDSAAITVECPELEVVKTAVNDPIIAGDDAEFTITVTNVANGTALDVQITDDLPSGLDWSEENVSCNIMDGTLECDVGTLLTGEDFSVSVNATTSATECGTASLSNTAFADASNQDGSSEDSATITVDCPELEVLKTAVNDPVSAGEDAEFMITVTNVGNATAFDVTLTDDLPGGLDWSEENDSCGITNNTLECDVGTLPAGEDFSVTVRATTSAMDCGVASLSNTAIAEASNQDGSPEDSATITVECPELEVVKTALNDPVSAGEDAEFTITVTNIGNGTAFDVTLTDELPGGLAWSGDNDSCSVTDGTLECEVGTLLTGEDFSVTVSATTTANECGPELISNTAIADASNQEGSSEDSATITVECPELEVVKTAVNDPISAGEDAEFTITVTNIGNGTAFDVTLTDELPGGLDWSEENDSCSITNGTLECDVGTLLPGKDFVVNVSATTTANECATEGLINTAFADASNQDGSSQNSATITVECPELVVEKSASNDPISAGEDAEFTITVTNIGNGTAFDVTLTDELPGGLDWSEENDSCSITNGTLECDVGTLPTGEVFSVVLRAMTSHMDCGDEGMLNTAAANASNQNGTSDGSATILVQCPELVVEKSASNDPISAGEDAEFTITVTNIGNGTAFDVTLTDDLPAGLNWTHDQPACDITNNTLECVIGTLATDEAFNVSVKAATFIPQCSQPLDNTAFSDASNHNGTSEDSAAITVECPELVLEKAAISDSIGPGENATFAIHVTNIGNGTAFDVSVTDELPSGLQWEILGDTPDCAIGENNTLACTVRTLDPGAGLSVTISALVSGEACALITNNVTLNAFNHAPRNSTASVLCFQAQALAQILYSAITTPESVEYQTHGVDQRGEGNDTRRVVGIDTEAFLGETVLPQVEAEALEEHGEVHFDGQRVNVSAHTTATEVRLMGGDIVIRVLHNEGNLSWDPLDGSYDVDGFYRIASLRVFGEEISVDGTPLRIDLPGGGYLDLFTEELDDEGNQVTYRSRLAHLYLPVRLDPDLSELPLPLQELITANATRAEVIVGEVQLRAGYGMNLTGQERLILEPDDAGSGRDASLDEPVALATGVFEGGLPDNDPNDAYAIEADAGDMLAVVLEPATRTWAQGGSVDVGEAVVVNPPEATFSLRDYRLRLLDPDGTVVMEQYTEDGVLPAVVLHSSLHTGTYRVVIDSMQEPPAANYTLAVVVAPFELPLELPLGDPLAGGVEPIKVVPGKAAPLAGPFVDRSLPGPDL